MDNELLKLRFCVSLRMRAIDSVLRKYDTGPGDAFEAIPTAGEAKQLEAVKVELSRILNIKVGQTDYPYTGGPWNPPQWSSK